MLKIDLKKEKFNGIIGDKKIDGEKIILAKPQTFMNLSGDFVSSYMKYYKIEPKDLIVVYDDIDIKPGKIRVKPSGSAGTHNGMRDITKKLQSNEFVRIRVGTGKPQEGDLVDYVLGTFSEDEEVLISKAIKSAAQAVVDIIENGTEYAMNKYN